MLRRRSNLSDSYCKFLWCFPIQTTSNKVISYDLIKDKYDAAGLISISEPYQL